MYDVTTIRIKDLKQGDEFQRLGLKYKVVKRLEDQIRIRRISGYSSNNYILIQGNSNEKVSLLKTLEDFVENKE